MATEVLVERADLDEGVVMIYREFSRRLRLAYDPARITERAALTLLGQRVAGVDAMTVHRADT